MFKVAKELQESFGKLQNTPAHIIPQRDLFVTRDSINVGCNKILGKTQWLIVFNCFQ